MPKPSRISVVNARGQTSIPSELCRELSIDKGNRLLWEKIGDGELRVVILPEAEPRGATAMLGFASEWMAELREGEDRCARHLPVDWNLEEDP